MRNEFVELQFSFGYPLSMVFSDFLGTLAMNTKIIGIAFVLRAQPVI